MADPGLSYVGKDYRCSTAVFADVIGSPVWDARLLMKRHVVGSGRGMSADAIVEALLPLDRGLLPRVPDSFKPLRSQSMRFGIVISY